MGKPLITGLDIGQHTIKAVVLKPTKKADIMVCHAEVFSNESIVADNQKIHRQIIVNKLKELKKKLPFGAKRVVLALPDNAVISKCLQIDADLDGIEKEYAIQQAFALQSPLPIEELVLDYVMLEDKRELSSSVAYYQVYAARRNVVQERMEILKQSGFTPLLIDTQAHGLFSVLQCFITQNSGRNYALVDIGEQQVSICILNPQHPPYYKDFPFGMQSFLRLVSDQAPVNLTQENIEPSVNDDVERQFIAKLSENLVRQIGVYQSSFSQAPIEGIVLTGEGAKVPYIDEQLTQSLSLPVQLFEVMGCFDEVQNPQENTQSYGFSLASGLAIRGAQWQGGHRVA